MLSKEWTIWHLTPNGWIRGDQKLDFGGRKSVDEPSGTILSMKYKETMSHAYSSLNEEVSEIWNNGDQEQIERIRKKYPFPNCI